MDHTFKPWGGVYTWDSIFRICAYSLKLFLASRRDLQVLKFVVNASCFNNSESGAIHLPSFILHRNGLAFGCSLSWTWEQWCLLETPQRTRGKIRRNKAHRFEKGIVLYRKKPVAKHIIKEEMAKCKESFFRKSEYTLELPSRTSWAARASI